MHSHNDKAKYELKSLLSDLGLNPVILHEQNGNDLQQLKNLNSMRANALLHVFC